MKRSVCPITKQPLDCKVCKVIKDNRCPYWEFDEAIEHTLQLLREIVEKEKNEKG